MPCVISRFRVAFFFFFVRLSTKLFARLNLVQAAELISKYLVFQQKKNSKSKQSNVKMSPKFYVNFARIGCLICECDKSLFAYARCWTWNNKLFYRRLFPISGKMGKKNCMNNSLGIDMPIKIAFVELKVQIEWFT